MRRNSHPLQRSTRRQKRSKRKKADAVRRYSFCMILGFLFHQGMHNVLLLDNIAISSDEQLTYFTAQSQASNGSSLRTNDTHNKDNDTSNANSTLSVPDESYWLETLDISNPIQCGANKCFFPQSKSSKQGWLLAPKNFRFEKRKNADQVYATLEASYALAHNLTLQHNAQHFMLSPPMQITLSKRLENHLNQNLYSEARHKKLSKRRFKKVAIAQLVRKAPLPALIFGCTASKRGLFFSQVEQFAAQVQNSEAFLQNLKTSFKSLKQLLSVETCLFIDFHVLVSVNGDIYHLDLDRCFSTAEIPTKRRKKQSSSCLQFFHKVETTIYKHLNKTTTIEITKS